MTVPIVRGITVSHSKGDSALSSSAVIDYGTVPSQLRRLGSKATVVSRKDLASGRSTDKPQEDRKGPELEVSKV